MNYSEFNTYKDTLTAWAKMHYDDSYGAQVILECRDDQDWIDNFKNNKDMSLNEALQFERAIAGIRTNIQDELTSDL